MKMRIMQIWLALPVAAALSALAPAQEPQAAPAVPQQSHNNVRRLIAWREFDYMCEGDAKLTVYLRARMAKVRYEDHAYLMEQTPSADGNRYSDGKVVWWGKGDSGFLQQDTPDGDGKMIVKDCKLDQPLNAATVSGTVTYLQRIALPPEAVIDVKLRDLSVPDANEAVIAEVKITLGDRQVPVPFELKAESTQIDQKHRYAVSATITVESELRFATDRPYPVLTQGYSSRVDLMMKQAHGTAPK